MAQYNRLTTDTYTFKYEVTVHNNGSIDRPLNGNLPKMKVIQNNQIYYSVVRPVTNYVGTTDAGWVRNDSDYTRPQLSQSFTVNGMEYCGYRECYFQVYYTSNKTLGYNTIVPACQVTAIISNREGHTNTQIINLTSYEGYHYNDSNHYYTFAIPKTSDEQILSMSVKYTTYTLTFNSGDHTIDYLQQSLDGGNTYTELFPGQAEAETATVTEVTQLILKNTSENYKVQVYDNTAIKVGEMGYNETFVLVPSKNSNYSFTVVPITED